jgi:hypothetical protein
MGAKIQAFDIFQTPLSSHYPLPLSSLLINKVSLYLFHTYVSNLTRLVIRNGLFLLHLAYISLMWREHFSEKLSLDTKLQYIVRFFSVRFLYCPFV